MKTSMTISTDKTRLDLDMIHAFLSKAYWSEGIPRDVVERAIANSLCFGAYTEEGKQVAFARVITDTATFAYLADVFVLPEFRGQGISKQLMEAYTAHPELQGLRRHLLATGDAHTLYQKFGFTSINEPEMLMMRHAPNVYQKEEKE